MTVKTIAELESKLAGYCGTEQYHRYLGGLVLTDGVKAFAQEAGAFWLLDVIASYQHVPKVKALGMQFWKINVAQDKSWTVTCREDSGIPPVVTQKDIYTDFPIGEYEIWVQEGEVGMVAMLKGEY